MLDIRVTATPPLWRGFSHLLGKGVCIRVRVGGTLKEVLCGQVGLSEAYLNDRVQTVFHNGKAVDDIETVIIEEGSIIALSAAMPGLAGAVLRKGGVFASMRSQISHPRNDPAGSCRQATIVLKLFNLLVREAGPLILSRGIILHMEDFQILLNALPVDFACGLTEIEINGTPGNAEQLVALCRGTGEVFLQVILQESL